MVVEKHPAGYVAYPLGLKGLLKNSMAPKRVVEMPPAEYIQQVEEEYPVAAEAEEQEECPAGENFGAQDKDTGAVVLEHGEDTTAFPKQSPEGRGRKQAGKRKRREMKTNATYVSRTDPDARIFARPGQPIKLGYIECVTVDSFANIITAVEVRRGQGAGPHGGGADVQIRPAARLSLGG